jgi:protease II
MNGDPSYVRNIGHAKWYDPLAKLEDRSSAEFKAAVKNENKLWTASVKPLGPAIQTFQKKFDNVYVGDNSTQQYIDEVIQEGAFVAKIQHGFGHRLNVWVNEHTYLDLSDFGKDPDSDHYYTIKDVGNGAEQLELTIYQYGKKAWSKFPVGPNAAFRKGQLYYQTVENALRYPTVVATDAYTGKHPVTVYNNEDKRFQVELHAPPRQPDVFIKIQNALSQRLARIVGRSGITWITPDIPKDAHGRGISLFPICEDAYLTNVAVVFKGHSYKLPVDQHGVEAYVTNDKDYLIITTSQVIQSAYVFDTAKKVFTPILKGTHPNEIRLHTYSSRPTLELCHPAIPNSIYEVVGTKLALVSSKPTLLKLPYFSHGLAKSVDGTSVPYTYVSAVKNPKKLIVEAYGAYGISGHRCYPYHWIPYLQSGYALVVAFPRGGREDGDAWYDGGRTALRKHNTFDDTAAVIQTVQKRYIIKPSKAVFYGRSAGGWLAAAIALFYPHLVRVVYAEVPYLDVLRTTTNAKLPLTILEYDEFGNPAMRPDEYAALQRISPVDAVYPAPKHAPLVLLKTAVNDVQVLPYEALKFSQKLRAHGWNVLVGIDGEGGHFAASTALASQQAIDAALIDQALAAPTGRRGRTRKLRSHVSIGTHRRSTRAWKA